MQCHKILRMSLEEVQFDWNGSDSRRILFSDKKDFNLDEPNGLNAYWNNLDRDSDVSLQSIEEKNCLLFGEQFPTNVCWVWFFYERTLDARYYCNVLEKGLLDEEKTKLGDVWKFTRDNTSVHLAEYTLNWFLANEMHTLDWFAMSPDLNIIENVWRMLAREVYALGRQI